MATCCVHLRGNKCPQNRWANFSSFPWKTFGDESLNLATRFHTNEIQHPDKGNMAYSQTLWLGCEGQVNLTLKAPNGKGCLTDHIQHGVCGGLQVTFRCKSEIGHISGSTTPQMIQALNLSDYRLQGPQHQFWNVLKSTRGSWRTRPTRSVYYIACNPNTLDHLCIS